MTRWHLADCAAPDVVVDTSQTPHCRSCKAVVAIDRIIAEHVAHHVPVEIPPDEPIGQMALWWPPSVPYSPSPGNDLGNQLRDKINKAAQAPSLAQPRSPTPSPTASHSTYETALSAKEFRLARFDALQDGFGPDHPIHITLDVFPRDDCPEYETVSYTWGGEEDDSTPCRPVFVGPYWDVLLQTSNCWDMLRYLRPARGIRFVWIDAICINQSDAAERAIQVSSMRSVYQQCSRVVVFLGADLAATPPTIGIEARVHPSRHALHEFDRVMTASPGVQETAMTLPDLLTRRYFSRVWVVQELLLSREAVIPIAGREFWANNLTPIKYEDATPLGTLSGPDEWNWGSTAAPWMRDLCGGSLHASTDFYDVLCRTWRCRATDPRDRVFGVLGLVESHTPSGPVIVTEKPDGSSLTTITPDYNISTRHVFTGILAHILLNIGNADVLIGAAGLAAPSHYPSWLPDMRMLERPRGECDFQPPESRSRGRDVGISLIDWLPTAASSAGTMSEIRDSEDERNRNVNRKASQRSVVLLTHLSSILQRKSRVSEVVLKTAAVDDPIGDSKEPEIGVPWSERRKSLSSLYGSHSWRASATIDPSTGDLSLKVGHLLQFESRPQRVDCHPRSSDTVAVYEIQEGSCSLFIAFSKEGPELDKFVPAGKNHLFYLQKEDAPDEPPGFLLLFLLEVGEADMDTHHGIKPKEFKLVLCCPYLDVLLTCPQPPNDSRSFIWGRLEVDVRHSLYAVLVGINDGLVMDFPNWKDMGLISWNQMFPYHDRSYLSLDVILSLGQIILSSVRSGTQDVESAFADAYLDCLVTRLPQNKARLVKEIGPNNRQHAWIEMTLVPPPGIKYWSSSINPFSQPWGHVTTIPWEWRYFVPSPHEAQYPRTEMVSQPHWRRFGVGRRGPGPDGGMAVMVRARVSDLIKFVKSTRMFKQMERLHFMFRAPENSNERPLLKVKTWAGEENETDMILRGPQEGDHYLPERPYRPWPEEIVRNFKADGEYWNIRIS